MASALPEFSPAGKVALDIRRHQQLAPFREWSYLNGFDGDRVAFEAEEVTNPVTLRNEKMQCSIADRVFHAYTPTTFTKIYIDRHGELIGVIEHPYYPSGRNAYRIIDQRRSNKRNFLGLGIRCDVIGSRDRRDEVRGIVLVPRDHRVFPPTSLPPLH